ncbi:DUF2283 domain-containing protein [Salinibacter ruber]|uniref:Uncharacterized protein YuzE n=1 Tax=Salinibacter ruber TaxID=146919 RepID=A0A9X2UB10_9BACT|nr:DUF2283 domain-containing protein [Salinibacter ruber]MCS3953169.1 uncharacterized protein YuzE [Salinibacter ruber]
MKVTYDPEADVLCVHLRDRAPVDAVEEPDGIIVSYGDDGEPVSVEFLDAAERGLTSAEEVSVTVQAAVPQFSTPQ